MKRNSTDRLALAATNTSHVGITKPRSGLDHRIQHRLQIECRSLITFSTSLVAVWYRETAEDRRSAYVARSAAAHSPSRSPPARRSFQQRDFLVRERPDLQSGGADDAEQDAVLA